MKYTIHDEAAYKLTAVTTHNEHTGRTVELFQHYPLAQKPRDQRLVSFTLPESSFRKLAEVLACDES